MNIGSGRAGCYRGRRRSMMGTQLRLIGVSSGVLGPPLSVTISPCSAAFSARLDENKWTSLIGLTDKIICEWCARAYRAIGRYMDSCCHLTRPNRLVFLIHRGSWNYPKVYHNYDEAQVPIKVVLSGFEEDSSRYAEAEGRPLWMSCAEVARKNEEESLIRDVKLASDHSINYARQEYCNTPLISYSYFPVIFHIFQPNSHNCVS